MHNYTILTKEIPLNADRFNRTDESGWMDFSYEEKSILFVSFHTYYININHIVLYR